MIGQFSGPTLLYGPPKFKVGFVAKLFCGLSPSVLTFIACKSLKLFKTFFTIKLCFNRFQIDSFCFRGASVI